MKETFKHSRGKVEYLEGTTKGFDPTSYTNITITRNDGRVFKVNSFWDTYIVHGGKEGETPMRHYEVVEWMKSHSLPSLDWIEQKVSELHMAYSEDPMGHPSQYE